MINIQKYIKKKVCQIISTWDKKDIYAVSFFLYANEMFEYNGYSNVTAFSVGYNTETDCDNADRFAEKRWNYAFWSKNEIPVIKATDKDEGMKTLFEWYKQNHIDNIGYENFNDSYNVEMQYIGKGPIGYYELLLEITAVARELQVSGFIKDVFGKPVPIIIHDLEYPWYVLEATRQANPNGEANDFFAAMRAIGVV